MATSAEMLALAEEVARLLTRAEVAGAMSAVEWLRMAHSELVDAARRLRETEAGIGIERLAEELGE